MTRRYLSSFIVVFLLFIVFTLCCDRYNCEAAGEKEASVETLLTPELFGAVGDGITDDTAAIQAMFDSCVDEGVVTFRSGAKYILTDTVTVKRFTSIEGNGCSFKMRGNKFSVDGFCFAVNTDGNTTLSINYKYRPFFRNCYLEADGNYYGENNGIICANHITIDHITFDGIDIVVRFTDEYIDMCEVSDIYIRGRQGDNYAIYGGNLGDGRCFSRIMMGAGSNNKLLYLGRNHLVASVSEIAGRNIIETGSPTYFEQVMLSFSGRIIVNGADCTFNNVYATMDDRTESPIEINSTVIRGITQAPHIKMSNCFFYVTQNRADTHTVNPIQINGCKSFTFENVLTGYVDASTSAVAKTFAQITSSLKESIVYNRFPQALNGKTVTIGEPISFAVNAFSDGVALGKATYTARRDATWTDETGTFYYRLAIMPDDELSIGSLSEEESVLIEDHEHAVRFSSKLNNGFQGKKLRVYRGVESNCYTKYADLYALNTAIIDSGNSINGVLWKSMEPESVPLELSTGVDTIEYLISGSKCHRELRAHLTNEDGNALSGDFQPGDVLIFEPFGFNVFDGRKWIDIRDF